MFCVALVAAVSMLFSTTAVSGAKPTGMYARSAVPVWDMLGNASERKAIKMASPDYSNVLVASAIGYAGVLLSLERAKSIFWTEEVRPGVGIEIAWSPDSKAFFVTTSNAGRNGNYELTVYFVNGKKVTKRYVTPAILNAFGHPVKCDWEEDPNVAAVKWLNSSKRLIVAAEIVNHSNCDSYGTFRAYEVALPEVRIIKTYGQIESKRLFGKDIGWELKDAPDKCITHPKSCAFN
jgi:hypothetical protein